MNHCRSKQVKSLSWTLLLTCFSLFLFAQEKQDSLETLQLLAEAEVHLKNQQFPESIKKATLASNQFAEQANWPNFRKSQYIIFLNGFRSNNFNGVIPILQEGLNTIPKTREEIHRMKSVLAYCYMREGDIFTGVGIYESLIPDLIEARDSNQLGGIYGNISAGYMQIHDFAKAVKYADNAVRLSEQLPDKEEYWRNLIFNGQAHFWNRNYGQAERSFKRAQILFDPRDGTFAKHFSLLYLAQGKYEEALEIAEKAIPLIDERKAENKLYALLINKGKALFEMGEREKAIVIFEQSIGSAEALSNPRELAIGLTLMADTYKELGQLPKALATYQKALSTFLPNFNIEDTKVNPTFNELVPEAMLVNIFSGKGECYARLAREAQEVESGELAEENYHMAIDFIDEVKLGFDETASKLMLGEGAHLVYEKLLNIKAEKYSSEPDMSIQNEAFEIAQKANAFVLRELLNTQQAMELAEIPEEKIESWKILRREKQLLNRLVQQASSNEKDSIQQLLFDQEFLVESYKDQLLKDYPTFAALYTDLSVASIGELQNNIEVNGLMIKYFLGEERLHIFAISKERIVWKNFELPDDFEQAIYQYRRSISDLDFVKDSTALAEEVFLESAHRIYQILLAPILDHSDFGEDIKRITIVGDGIINTIPFQSLLMKPGKDWKTPSNFLLSKYALNYVYFCKMLLEDNPTSGTPDDFVSFGLEFDKATLDHLQKIAKDSIINEAILDNMRSGTLTNLPFSDDEAKNLAELMNGKYWINEKATKTNFMEVALSANFIHMATHSILDEQNPNLSALVFTKQNDSQDNLLRQEEIYHLDMDADLIVLSACNTAYGQGLRGEGLNSLARAFNVSGIPSVTATFWNIADEASKKLMELYYANLKAGLPKDIALQKAQMTYLQDDNISSPAFRLPPYWAAWVNIGDPAPIVKTKSIARWLWGTGLLVIIFLAFQWRKH